MTSIVARLLGAIAWLVPSTDRDAWLREWTAEFSYALTRPGSSRPARFGAALRLRSALRHALWLRMEGFRMGSILQDLRFALRLMARQPTLTIAVIVTLAFGIGVNAAVYGVARGAMLRPLPIADVTRVVVAWQTAAVNGNQAAVFSYPDYQDWISSARAVDRTALVSAGVAILTGVPDPGRVQSTSVTAGLFELLGRMPRGRAIEPADQIPGAERVVIVSDVFGRQHFGDRDPIGSPITLDGIPRRIVGVMTTDPLAALFPPTTDVWVPIVLRPQIATGRGNRNFVALAHLAPGSSVDAAQAELATTMARLATDFPATNKGRGARVVPVQAQLASSVSSGLLIASLVAGLVLLAACANVANMILARNFERAREFAVRAALGAGRARLVRQVLIESLMLSLVGGAVAIALVMAFGAGAAARLLTSLPRQDEIGADPAIIVGGLTLSLLTAFASGLPAAWRVGGAANGASTARHTAGGLRVRRWLVAGQLGVAMLLLVVGGLLVRSFERIQRVDPGFDPGRVATVQIQLPRAYDTADKAVDFVDRLVASVEQNPGVERAGLFGPVPFSGHRNRWSVTREGDPLPNPVLTDRYIVTGGSLAVMGVRLAGGRAFEPADFSVGGPPVAIVDDVFAAQIFGGTNPVGRHFKLESNPWTTIVGLTSHVKHYGLDETGRPQVYIPFAQDPAGWLNLVVRARTDATAILPDIRRAILQLDPMAPPYGATSVAQLLSETFGDRRLASALVGGLALVTLVIAAAGLYGAMAFSVWRRTREIGVRLALGARRAEVSRLVLAEAARIVMVGAAAGTIGAMLAVRLVRTLLFDTAAYDPLTYAIVGTSLAAIALAASYLPARRAARIDPIQALRME